MGDEEDTSNKRKGITTCNGIVFQSSGIQRAVRGYNDYHAFLLAYCCDLLWICYNFLYSLLSSKSEKQES